MNFIKRFISYFRITKKNIPLTDIGEINFYKYSFQELSQMLKDCKYEMIFLNNRIVVEWDIGNYTLKIEYDEEGQFRKLIHYKIKK